MERKIRKLKRLAEGTLDEQAAKEYRKKLKAAQRELKEFIGENEGVLRRDYSREKVYGNGVDKSAESGIIEENNSALILNMQYFANKNIQKMSSNSLKKSITSWTEKIELHKSKLSNPEKHCLDWDSFDSRYQDGLKRHWNHEIKTFSNDIQEALDELKKRGDL